MGKTVRNNPPGSLALETIVPDSLGGIQRLLYVAWLKKPFPFHHMAPHAREAVGLQFKHDREPVGPRLIRPGL